MGLSVSLVGIGVLQAVVYLFFIRFIDLYEREELRYVIPVFVWGFTVAVVGSGIVNTSFLVVFNAVLGPSAAEFFTAIAEDISYYAQFGVETYLVRRIFGGFAHAAFTSLTGIGIGLIPWVRSRVLKVLLPIFGLAGAITLHATFNFAGTFFGPLVAYSIELLVVVLYILVIVVWLAVERRTIRRELREEVATGTISADEYSILPTYFARTFYYLALLFRGRFKEWHRARKVHEATVNLAFTKRLNRNSHAAPQGRKAEILRRRIAELR